MSAVGWTLWGLVTGFALALGTVWWPTRSYYRRKLGDRAEVFRITHGFGPIEGAVFEDADQAYAQARAAYLPIYPGRAEDPDDAWVDWIKEGGFDYYAPHTQNRHLDTGSYRPQHHLDGDPGEGLRPDGPPIIQDWDLPANQGFTAQWGEDILVEQQAEPPSPDWTVTWAWRERLLIPLALVLSRLPHRGRRYPRWQRVADVVWEGGVVFEITGARVNARIARGLERLVIGVADTWHGAQEVWAELSEAVYDIRTDLVSWPGRVRRLFPDRRVRSVPRAKRHYAIGANYGLPVTVDLPLHVRPARWLPEQPRTTPPQRLLASRAGATGSRLAGAHAPAGSHLLLSGASTGSDGD